MESGKRIEMIGTIVLASKRGFYFVAAEPLEEQYFLHASAVANRIRLKSGDRVSFNIEEHPQGRTNPRAVNAVKLETEIETAADTVKGDYYAKSVRS